MSGGQLPGIPAFFLDCQATGSHARGGHLVEMAWGQLSRSSLELDPDQIQSHLVRLPEDIALPDGVKRVTGISEGELKKGLPLDPLARIFRAELARSSQLSSSDPPLIVIHYARFEEPYLEELLELHPFSCRPFEIVCTHEISRRLLDFLPRRGLRAVAGYFGHSTPRMRRASDHVLAGSVIWSGLLPLLASQGVDTLSDLRRWLLHRSVVRRSERRWPLKSRLRLSLPDLPGVYRLLRCNGDVLYVGKASSLKTRVNSYFQKRWKGQERTLELLSQVQGVEVSPTRTSLEAALLEVAQIQQFDPPYNVALRSQQRAVFFLSERLELCSEEDPGGCPGRPVVLPQKSPLPRLLAVLEHLLAGRPVLPELVPGRRGDWKVWERGLSDFSTIRLKPFQHLSSTGCLRALAFHLKELELETIEEELGVSQELDPASVVRTLDRVVLWANRSLARARWLGHLKQQARVHWPSPRRELEIVVFQGAISLHSGPDGVVREMPAGDSVESGWTVSLYDRLRVLSSEMKRGLREERPLVVSLGGRGRLEGTGLQEALRWV